MPGWSETGLPSWATDATKPCQTISQVLIEQAQQYLLTVSISSISGSACFIYFANRLPRRQWLMVSFLVLALLFITTGGVYYGVAHTTAAPATVTLVAVCHFAFNFGANTLTFLIPAEIFPTCYRCTCHGISAAAGKVGSLIAVLVVYGINTSYTSHTRQGLIFILFGSVLFFGAVYAWAYLPEPQRRSSSGGDRHLESKTLEELGGGRERARVVEGEVITVRDKIHEIRRRRQERQRQRQGHGFASPPSHGRIDPQLGDGDGYQLRQHPQRQHNYGSYTTATETAVPGFQSGGPGVDGITAGSNTIGQQGAGTGVYDNESWGTHWANGARPA